MIKRALVTYGWCRSAWAALRNLSQHGIETYAGDSSSIFMAGHSKYCKGSFIYPTFYTRPTDFIKTVSDFIDENEISTYIPIHEEILVVSKYRNYFKKNVITQVALFLLISGRFVNFEA